ncbi:MAG TPA: hypothetical protein PLF01_01230 [Alphaproteobacteria bacterium]|nr:hypothetical protein [Alphaproteobacteria bacterium]
MKSKSFDIKTVQKYFSAQSADDLNRFLEKLPQNAGQTVLVAAAIAWGMAGAAGLYTAIETQKLTELREELKATEALKPAVPKINNIAIPKAEVEKFVENAKKSYKGLDIKVNGSTIIITATSTANFAEFREAIGHVQNGGDGWRVSLEKLCVGRECDRQFKLAASLKVNKVSVEKPS